MGEIRNLSLHLHSFSLHSGKTPPLLTTLAWALHLGADKIARVHMLTLVWLIRSLSISVVCLLFVVLCQIVCSECAFAVCGTNVTFVLVRVVDCFFCLSDWYSVVKLQSAPVSQRGIDLSTGGQEGDWCISPQSKMGR